MENEHKSMIFVIKSKNEKKKKSQRQNVIDRSYRNINETNIMENETINRFEMEQKGKKETGVQMSKGKRGLNVTGRGNSESRYIQYKTIQLKLRSHSLILKRD